MIKPHLMKGDFDLDKILIEFTSDSGTTSFTIRDAVEGVQIFGGIGSGKTSGSGRMIALKYLSHGFGGLVLTAKADEKDLWIEYCRKTNRLDDLIIIKPGDKNYFNFLEYESTPKPGDLSITENIVQVLKTVIQASEEKTGGKSDDQFWETALDMLIANVIDLCLLAYGKVSIDKLYNIVLTAPKKDKAAKQHPDKDSFDYAYRLAIQKFNAKLEALKASFPPEVESMKQDAEFMDNLIYEKIPEARIIKSIDQFFAESYRNLGEKTRSIIEFYFIGFLYRLLQEPVCSLFCRNHSTVTPDDCLKGKIILLDLPVKRYHKVGRDAQVMFKYIWQRAMERRNVKNNSRPVFLFADEAQHFLHEHDPEYQATARSSIISTVYISQNLPNYHANMGGLKSEYRVKSFLGTLGTKIFHANADIETNKYASELIGEGYTEDPSHSTTIAGNFSATQGTSYKLERMVRPEEFVGLKTGGTLNDNCIEAYMHKQGKKFHDEQNHRKITFKQR
jgi:hypothetical protein